MRLLSLSTLSYFTKTICFLGLSSLASCGPESASQTLTDLGSGNAAVAAAFAQHLAGPEHCSASGTGRRVLITGFGAFQTTKVNPSGAVLATLAAPQKASNLEAPAKGAAPYPARVAMRQMTIDGRAYELCLLTLDVKWDLAAAIMVHEAAHFDPLMVLMTGLGGDSSAYWEFAARNLAAVGKSGYDSKGRVDDQNRPISAPILAGQSEMPPSLLMSWDSHTLATITAPAIAALGFESVAPPEWRQGNDYICNNVSFVVLAAQAGLPLSLAGGLLDWKDPPELLHLPLTTQIGFFHYPLTTSTNPASLNAWSKVIVTAIGSALAQW